MPARFLDGQRLVLLQAGSAFRRHVEAGLARVGVTALPAVEVGNLSLVRRFVAAGLGMAPVPAVAFSAGDPEEGVRRRRLAGIPPVRDVAVGRAGAPLPEPVRALLEKLQGR